MTKVKVKVGQIWDCAEWGHCKVLKAYPLMAHPQVDLKVVKAGTVTQVGEHIRLLLAPFEGWSLAKKTRTKLGA